MPDVEHGAVQSDSGGVVRPVEQRVVHPRGAQIVLCGTGYRIRNQPANQ